METTISVNDVKKDLYKSKVNAKFSHYTSGNLYYTVELVDGIYQFPISTIEKEKYEIMVGDKKETGDVRNIIKLSSDLGTTSFNNEMKGSDLNRWISKAIAQNEFVKIN